MAVSSSIGPIQPDSSECGPDTAHRRDSITGLIATLLCNAPQHRGLGAEQHRHGPTRHPDDCGSHAIDLGARACDRRRRWYMGDPRGRSHLDLLGSALDRFVPRPGDVSRRSPADPPWSFFWPRHSRCSINQLDLPPATRRDYGNPTRPARAGGVARASPGCRANMFRRRLATRARRVTSPLGLSPVRGSGLDQLPNTTTPQTPPTHATAGKPGPTDSRRPSTHRYRVPTNVYVRCLGRPWICPESGSSRQFSSSTPTPIGQAICPTHNRAAAASPRSFGIAGCGLPIPPEG